MTAEAFARQLEAAKSHLSDIERPQGGQCRAGGALGTDPTRRFAGERPSPLRGFFFLWLHNLGLSPPGYRPSPLRGRPLGEISRCSRVTAFRAPPAAFTISHLPIDANRCPPFGCTYLPGGGFLEGASRVYNLKSKREETTMKKRITKKLQLNSETLRRLSDSNLLNAAGGLTQPRESGCPFEHSLCFGPNGCL